MKKNLTKNQLRRLPEYLNLLKNLSASGSKVISCQTIADTLNLNKELVRKDVALVSSIDGVPNKGRDICLLIKDIEKVLGYDDSHNAVLVGVGSLGRALLGFKGFSDFGLKIVCAFDTKQSLVDTKINGIQVYDSHRMFLTIHDLNAHIGIICVQESKAQEVADELVNCGIEAIWNFAPIQIETKKDIIVSNMNMAESLAVLSHQLYLKKKGKKEKK